MMVLKIFLVLITMLNAWFALLNIMAYYTGSDRPSVIYLAIFQILIVTVAINNLVNS